MTLYTTTVVTPPPARRRWKGFLIQVGYAIGFPIVLIVAWAIWTGISPQKFFPPPLTILEAFVDTWIGPAFFTDVIPSLYRLALGIILRLSIWNRRRK